MRSRIDQYVTREGGGALNSELRFTAGELLYLAALLGATEFTGVEDVFYGMDDQEIVKEITALQGSLEQKGYAAADFNGSFTISEEVSRIISTCIDSHVEVIFDKNEMGMRQSQDIYYVKNRDIVRQRKELSNYILSKLDHPQDIISRILRDIEWRPQRSQPASDTLKLGKDELLLLKNQIEGFDQASAFTTLSDRGICESTAAAIVDSFKDGVNYYSIMLSSCIGEKSDVAGLILIDTGNNFVEFVPTIVEDSEVILLKLQTVEGAKTAITKLVLENIPEGVAPG